MKITNNMYNVGVNSYALDLFEGQYINPNGMAYNSYLLLDEKIVLFDSVDINEGQQWLTNIKSILLNRQIDYLVVSHMEPDHSANIQLLLAEYPNLVMVGNITTFKIMKQFFEIDLEGRTLVVKSEDILVTGKHTLKFIFAPMVHWPEVMVTYDMTSKTIYSADAFGKFGTIDTDEDWACEARRYYFNIVGRYGLQVQQLLKKIGALSIDRICPLHGPILEENLSYYINLYDIWSSYKAEKEGVFIAYASIYGNTKQAAEMLKDELEKLGVKVSIADLARTDLAEDIEDAFKYSKLVVASPTYDSRIFPVVEDFINHLSIKLYQNRTVAFMENGTWAAQSAKHMKAKFAEMKNINLIDTTVSILSSIKQKDIDMIKELAIKLK